MDLLLVESNAARSQGLLGLLLRGPQRVVRVGESPIASGAFWPHHELTAAVLLGFEQPTMEKVRVLKRLWASDCALPSFIVTRPDSPGERLLSALLGDATIQGDWGVRGLRPATARDSIASLHLTNRIRLRAATTMSLERMMAIERVVAGTVRQAVRPLRAAA